MPTSSQLQKECKDFGSREPYHLLRHYGSYARAEREWTPFEELAELVRKYLS